MTRSISLAACKALFAREIYAGELLDEGKLAGAVAAPYQSVFGSDAYPTVVDKAAKLAESISTAHAYSDGNKRLAWLMTTTFLELNLIDVVADQDEAANMVVQLVAHAIDRRQFALWLVENTAPL